MSADTFLLNRPNRALLARFAASLLVAAAILAAASGRAVPASLAIAALAVLLFAELAYRYPAAAMCAGVVAIAAVPVYWGRPALGRTFVAVPATVAAVVLLPAAITQLRRLRVQAIDVWYGGYVLLLALAALVNLHSGLTSSAGLLWRMLLPYVVWRAISLHWLKWMTVLRVLVWTGAALAVMALVEHASGHNPFFTWVTANYQADQWAHASFRDGVVRTEASFGEPISFGLFLAVCLIGAATIFIVTRRRIEQVAAVGATVVMTIAVIDTQSRAALAVASAGVLLQLVRLLRTRRVQRIVLSLGFAAAAVVFTPVGGALQHGADSLTGTSSEALSAQYRLDVFDVLKDRNQYSLLGHPDASATGVSDLARTQSGLKSLDNEYAHGLVTGGVLALTALIGLAITLLVLAFGPSDPDPAVRSVTSALAMVMLGLLAVALLTQFADLFAILLAFLATRRQQLPDASPAVTP
jgi:hypothetical protein